MDGIKPKNTGPEIPTEYRLHLRLFALKTGLFVFAQSTLWLGGLLAIAGFPASTKDDAALKAVVLAVWAGALLLLSHATSPFEKIRYHLLAVPALLTGFLLPPAWMLGYVLLLVFLELLRTGSIAQRSPRSTELPETDEEFDGEIPDENVLQQTTRCRTEDGKDRFEGTFLLDYLDDQLTAIVHVPFVPPFENPPKIEVFLLDDAEAKTTVSPPQPFGVRVDVKRKTLDGPAKIRLALIAEEDAD